MVATAAPQSAPAAPAAAPALLPQHQALLDASAVDPGVVRERGYRSLTSPQEAIALGFAAYQARVPALLVPVWGADGQLATHQLRPDDPRLNDQGKALKYETPAGSGMVLDVPRRMRRALGDPRVRLFITEGARKVDAAVSVGMCAVGLLGVDCWRGTNPEGGKVALADWEVVALNGREVVIVFDSDVATKPDVRRALERLTAFLERRKAKVRTVLLPGGAAGKTGLDDWLAEDAARAEQDVLALPDVPAAAGDAAAAGDGPRLKMRLLSSIQAQPVEYLPGGVLLKGEFQMTVGDPGLGKTRLLLEACAGMTRGKAWPFGAGGTGEPGHVFYVGHEDSPETVVRPVVVEALGGDGDYFHVIDALEVQTRRGPREQLFTLSEAGVEALEAEMERFRPVLMVIDPVTGHLGGADSFKDAEVRSALMPLSRLAHQYGTAMVGNGHMTKDQQRAVAYRVGGSIAFYAVARAVFFVVEDPSDPRRRAFFHKKGNLAELAEARGFSIAGHHIDERLGSVGIPAWDTAPVEFGLEDALRAAGESQEAHEKREGVPQTVLRSILLTRGGRAPSEEVYAVAETLGVKRRTLERAKDALGVVSQREGFGPGSVSYWVLPAFAPLVAR